MFSAHGNFQKVCEINNLPYGALNVSRYTGVVISSGKFKGWFSYDETNNSSKLIIPEIQYKIFNDKNILIFEIREPLRVF